MAEGLVAGNKNKVNIINGMQFYPNWKLQSDTRKRIIEWIEDLKALAQNEKLKSKKLITSKYFHYKIPGAG